ncbi:MAG: transposase [Rhodoplanes sp.]
MPRPLARRLYDQVHAAATAKVGRSASRSGGQAHDIKGFTALLRMIGDKIDALLGDKGRDADAVREALKEIEVDVEAIIPSKSNRKQPIEFDRQAYKQRNLMEPGFNKLKNWPRIATCTTSRRRLLYRHGQRVSVSVETSPRMTRMRDSFSALIVSVA